MEETINKFFEESMGGIHKDKSFLEKLFILEKQWGLFVSWLRI